MADDPNKTGPEDADRINVNQDHELRYWTKTLGVDEAELKKLVKEHGVMAADVRAAIAKGKKK